MLKHTYRLLISELQLEWKDKSSLGSLLLYVLTTLMVIYLSIDLNLRPGVWNAIYWIVLLFGITGAVTRSFANDSKGQLLYLYTLVPPTVFLIARIFRNSVNSIGIALLTWSFFSLILGLPVTKTIPFAVASLLGSLNLAALLSFTSAMAFKAKNPHMLTVLLGFPLSIPVLLASIQLSGFGLGIFTKASDGQLTVVLCALYAILLGLSYVLFPYLWRD